MTPDTREKLIETARRLFHEQGYAATGVSTILREAGVHAGSLYHFFASKEDLLLAVLERYQALLAPVVMEPAERAEPDPIERVFALLAWYRAGLEATEYRMGCPIGNLALEVADSYPAARPLIDANFRGWAARIEGWLREAGEALPAGCDRAALSRFVLTVMEGGVMQARARGSPAPFDESVDQLRRYFALLRGEASREQGTRKGKP